MSSRLLLVTCVSTFGEASPAMEKSMVIGLLLYSMADGLIAGILRSSAHQTQFPIGQKPWNNYLVLSTNIDQGS